MATTVEAILGLMWLDGGNDIDEVMHVMRVLELVVSDEEGGVFVARQEMGAW